MPGKGKIHQIQFFYPAIGDPLIYILILNWNSHENTMECIKSCQELNYSNFTLLLIDNGSTDNSEQILREHYPEVDFLQTGNNGGYAKGNNMGIRRLTLKQCI